jgi:mevalonate kinase
MAAYWGRTLPPTELSALVYEVEKLYHGTPSGIDNTVIAFEQPVYFIKGLPVRRLIVKRSLTLVGGDTGRAAPTHEVVGDLRRRWQAAPQHYEGYFDEISALVQNARTIIERGLPGPPALGKLMNDNQEILEALGLSSPELAQLITAARRAGAFGAKLSGAGWGGTMIALAGPETAGTVAQALTAAGAATVFITEVR